MDGVIFKKDNFWMNLHKALGTYEQGKELTRKYLREDYAKLVEEVVNKLWKGKSADAYFELVKTSKYNPGVKEAVASMKKMGFELCIITSGPRGLLDRAKIELGIEDGVSNDLVIKDNLITGEFICPIAADNKRPILAEICLKHGISEKEVIAIGNGYNDVPKFEMAGFSIAFNSHCKELNKIADVVVEGNDMRDVLEVLPK